MTRRTTVLLGLLLAVLVAATSRATWATATAMDLAGSARELQISGADAAPAVLALGVVGIVASLASALSSAWIRFVTGPVLLLAGLGSAAASLAAASDPLSSSRAAISTAVGVVGGDATAESTIWPYLTVVPALLLAAIGVVVLARGGRWPRSSRYSRAEESARRLEELDPLADPAGAWDALTLGEDPTAQQSGAEGSDAQATESQGPGSQGASVDVPPARRPS